MVVLCTAYSNEFVTNLEITGNYLYQIIHVISAPVQFNMPLKEPSSVKPICLDHTYCYFFKLRYLCEALSNL